MAKWLRSYHCLIYICCGDNVSTNSTKKLCIKRWSFFFSKLGTVPLNSKLPPSHGKWIAAYTVTDTCSSQFSLLQKQKYNGTVRSWTSPESHIFLSKTIWKDVHKCDTAAWCKCHNSTILCTIEAITKLIKQTHLSFSWCPQFVNFHTSSGHVWPIKRQQKGLLGPVQTPNFSWTEPNTLN